MKGFKSTVFIKIPVSIILIGWIVYKVDIAKVWEIVQRAKGWWLLAALLLHIFGYWVSGERWKVLLRAQGVEVPLSLTVKSYLVGTFFNQFLPTIVGGAHLAIYARETLSYDCIDYAVTGEAEQTLPQLMRALVHGTPLAAIRGVAFRDAGSPQGVQVTAPAPEADVKQAPLPARHLLDNSIYYSFITRYRNFTPIITSRGCPFRCIFCEQGSKRFRARSPKDVVDELELVYKEFGVRELDFFDSSFTIQKDRVIQICEEIVRRRLKIVWAARSRVDCVTPAMLRAMRQAGCARIYYGVESGNPEILRVLRKSTNLELVRRVVRQTREAGIHVFGYFMIGNPYDDVSTIRQTIRLALELDLDYAQFSKVTPMPGTELYTMLMEETGRDWWREHILGGPEVVIPRPHCSLSEAEIQRWTRHAYLRFYYRPRYVMQALRRVRSWEELVRSVNTAVQMLVNRPTADPAANTEVLV